MKVINRQSSEINQVRISFSELVSGCDSVGRAVAFDTRDPQIEFNLLSVASQRRNKKPNKNFSKEESTNQLNLQTN